MNNVIYLSPSDIARKRIDDLNLPNQLYAAEKRNIEIQQEMAFKKEELSIYGYLTRTPPIPLRLLIPSDSSPDLLHVPTDLGHLAECLAEQHGMPIWQTLLACLGTMGIAIPGQYIVHVEDGWQEAVQLYMILAKASGSMKSALLRMLTKPIENRQNNFTESENDRGRAQWLNTVKEYNLYLTKETKKELFKRILKSDSQNIDIEKLIHDHVENMNKQLIDIEQESDSLFFINNFTPSSLELMMLRQRVLSICSPEDPFSACRLGDKSAVFPNLLLHGYDSENYQILKRNIQSNISRPSIAMLAAMTPETLLKYFNKEVLHDNGFLNRLLPCFMGDYTCVISAGYDRSRLMEIFYTKVEALLDQRLLSNAGTTTTALRLSDPAKRKVWEYKQAVYGSSLPPRCQGFMAKHPGKAIRLAALLHLWRFNCPEEQTISPEDMYTAIALCQALAPHGCYALDKEKRKRFADIDRVIRFIKSKALQKVNVSMISKNLNDLPKDKLLPVLDILDNHRFIHKIVQPNGTPEWIISPHIFSAYSIY